MDIYLIGEVGWDITLDSVLNQLKDLKEDDVLNVHIHSAGGSVYDGLAIYNHFKNLPNEVNTHSSGLVASIASIIFMAGKERTINTLDSFLIHLPMNVTYGNAKDLEKTAQELRDIEQKLAGIYAMETDLTAEEALEVMKEDKFLDVAWLEEKGFVSEVREFKAVATLNKNDNKMNNLTEEKVEGLFNKFLKKFENALKPKADPTNKIVQDATGEEIDFYELAEGDEVVVGSKARIDGSDAEGEKLMPSGETYVFEAGELTEIRGAEGEEEESEEMEALRAENAQLKEQLDALNSEKAELENKVEAQESAITAIREDFTNLKNEITSGFEADGKTKKEGFEPTKSRSLKGSK